MRGHLILLTFFVISCSTEPKIKDHVALGLANRYYTAQKMEQKPPVPPRPRPYYRPGYAYMPLPVQPKRVVPRFPTYDPDADNPAYYRHQPPSDGFDRPLFKWGRL